MKTYIITIMAAAGMVFSACNMTPIQQSAVQTVLQIGLRVAVAKIADANPGIAPYLQIVGSSLKQPIQNIDPDNLQQHISQIIASNVSDSSYKSALHEISDMVIDFYRQVYDRHSGQISESVYIEIISAFGDAIQSGASPSVASRIYTKQISDTLIIIE